MYKLYIYLKKNYNFMVHKIRKAIKILTHPVNRRVIVEHRNAEGKLLFSNSAALIDKGEENILKGWFQGVAANIPSVFTVNLATESSFLETAVIGDVTEVTGTGYAAVSVAHDAVDWTASHLSDPWIVTSKNCVFTAGGTWTVANSVVLSATVNSVDTLIAYAALTGPRQLYSGDTLTVSLVMSLE